jgi:RNA polymerase sigma factor (sigma-70 family)
MKSFFESHIWPLRGKLFRMVYLWTKDRDLSEDMLQNVFEKTVERQMELQAHPNLTGWMVKSLKNEVLMYFRKNGRTIGLEEANEISQPASNALELSDSHRFIFELVDSLPLKQREVFHLREVEEMSYEEISNCLEISLDQVKINLHRARKTIREKLINQGITP